MSGPTVAAAHLPLCTSELTGLNASLELTGLGALLQSLGEALTPVISGEELRPVGSLAHKGERTPAAAGLLTLYPGQCL